MPRKKKKNSGMAPDFSMTSVDASLGGCITREEYYRREKERDSKLQVKLHTTMINEVSTRKLA